MTLTDPELVRAIETSVLRMPAVPGQLEALGFAGVQGHFAHHVSDPLVNNVGDFSLEDDTVDEVIEQVLATYRSRGNSASWWTGPNSKPSRIQKALEAHGIRYEWTAEGFASTDLAAEVPVNPQIRVETISDQRLESSSRTFAAGFVFEDDPLPENAGRLWLTAVQEAPQNFYGRNYAAHLNGVEGAIAVASLFLVPGTEVALLSGASTLPEFRGNGAYTALVAARFADATRFGAKAAVIQATPETSSPVCERIGMRKLCELPVFISEPT